MPSVKMPEEYFEELGRRIAAAYISMEMGTTTETQYVGALSHPTTTEGAPYHFHSFSTR